VSILAQNALTTLDAVKDDLGITDPRCDSRLERAINVASGFIERYTGRIFYRNTAIVEKIAGFGGHALMVNRTPINSIASITFDGITVNAADYSIGDALAGTIHSNGGWSWTAHTARNISSSPIPGTERLLYTVTYDGGWYTPKQQDDTSANTRALPWDLEEVAIELSRLSWHAKSRNPGIASEKLLSWSASYSEGQIPSHVKSTLDVYRRAA